jgi:hypothetical protein
VKYPLHVTHITKVADLPVTPLGVAGDPATIFNFHLNRVPEKEHPKDPENSRMHPRTKMARRGLALTAVLFLLTACRQEELSLPVAHAAGTQTQSGTDGSPNADSFLSGQPSRGAMQLASEEVYKSLPGDSCYNFMLQRPKDQRATAVQARLKQFDHMAAALDSRTFTVDLVGDHANVLSLQFPIVWPASSSYTERVSAVVEEYFASPDIEDYLCNSGFAEVRLSARGLNDRRIHPIWTARVTSAGLAKFTADGQPLADEELVSLH